MERKILFLDLDGTLLNDEKEISIKNREALSKALSKGHMVVLTTGRALFSTIIQAKKLSLYNPGCYLIVFNGSCIYDCGNKEIINKHTLKIEQVCKAFDEANLRKIHIQTYDDKYVLVEKRNDDDVVRKYCSLCNMDYRVIKDIHSSLKEPPYKALVVDFKDQSPLNEMEEWLNDHLEGEVDTIYSNPYYLEIMPAGINKGYAVKSLCEKLGIDIKNSIACGDSENDLSMIRAAGTGVSMKNGISKIKEYADYITTHDNNHDGIAEVVERFML